MRQSEIYDIVFLENSRLIFSGIEELHKKMKHRNVEEYVKEQCEACFPENGADKRENNPLYPFFDFLKKEKQHLPRTNDDFWISETVNMLTLYNVIDQLSKEEKKERYPYLFEALCNSMREIMNSEICYLLYSQRDQIQMLSMSGFPDDMVSIPEDHNKKMDRSNMQLTQADFNELRKWIIQRRKNKDRESQRNHWDVAETLYAPKMNANQNLVVMVLNYPKYPQSSWKGEWIYLVFQYQKAIPDRATIEDDGTSRGSQGHEKWLEWNKLLVSARNLLYLRNQIMEQCNEKLYILLVSQRSYQYVMPLFPPESRKIRILHLTDLHLSERNKKRAWDFLDTYDWDSIKPVDLIVVTGDCIQGNNQAGVLEERYGIADSFIRKLAVRLWSEQGFVRADWRKRIIIIPGNHDYASMNELEAMSLPGDKRSTGLGYPAVRRAALW